MTYHSMLHSMQALRKSLIDQKRIINTVPEAPVFHPTVEEFADPLEFIASIKKAGETAGIVKIVPPAGKSAAIALPARFHNVRNAWCQQPSCSKHDIQSTIS